MFESGQDLRSLRLPPYSFALPVFLHNKNCAAEEKKKTVILKDFSEAEMNLLVEFKCFGDL